MDSTIMRFFYLAIFLLAGVIVPASLLAAPPATPAAAAPAAPAASPPPAPAGNDSPGAPQIYKAPAGAETQQSPPPASQAAPPPMQTYMDPLSMLNADQLGALQQPPALTPEEQEQMVRDEAFKQANEAMFPLTPEQVQQLMQNLTTTQQSAAEPPRPDPRPETLVHTLSLDPGAPPPVVQVAAGYVTTLSMLDATGSPWPIIDVAVGGNFEVVGGGEATHILRIIPMTRFGTGNMSIRMVGLTTPITFKLQSGGDVVYYRYDARIPDFGPGAATPIIGRDNNISAGDDETLMQVLEGTPPESVQRLKVVGADRRTQVFELDGRMYVRTPFALLSPGWDASISSSDGMKVYAVAPSPVLLLSDQGQMVRARVAITTARRNGRGMP